MAAVDKACVANASTQSEGAAKTASLARTNVQTEGNDAPLDSQTIMMIATAFGLSLLVTAWMFYRVTGGLFKYALALTPPQRLLERCR